ncbi:SDR family oxidoreductase [Corynebacterium glyciniphilum]|uniref:SDR family oxidoreductase n=1 Tax=Corynebacterium glyciniphilum TaxID=1404244 RepID=UPI0026522F80|nr:SDR family oxidoreductase [Corynebacterium glyciniphilum]MDN5684149.1 SDR family oxidoreductase [Corynebacterium glyciniphilum]MDN6705707.1 SDR family oxidoreductase [Corynebacterium glyciniphilum]
MDFGIRGKWAVIGASSQGLGFGCADALAAEGVNLVVNARRAGPLAEAADRLRSHGVTVHDIAGDISDPSVRASLLDVAPQVDILVTNAGGPPPGDFRDWDEGDWLAALKRNMLTPVELIKATVDDMAERGFGRVVNITSGAVKAPIAQLGLSNGARSGLTGFVAGVARQPQLASANVTVNNLLPGRFATARLAQTAQSGGGAAPSTDGVPAGRFGDPAEFGATCAFLCSAQAGYITGQNVLIDGGAYPGTM